MKKFTSTGFASPEAFDDRWLTVVQVASVLDTSPGEAVCLIRSGKLASVGFGDSLRVRLSELRRMIDEQIRLLERIEGDH